MVKVIFPYVKTYNKSCLGKFASQSPSSLYLFSFICFPSLPSIHLFSCILSSPKDLYHSYLYPIRRYPIILLLFLIIHSHQNMISRPVITELYTVRYRSTPFYICPSSNNNFNLYSVQVILFLIDFTSHQRHFCCSAYNQCRYSN